MNQLKLINHRLKSAGIGAVQESIKNVLCGKKDCFCTTCFSITQKTHPGVIWIVSKTSYTREDINPLLNLSELSRSQDDKLFFVLENPEFLHPAAANSLLKTLEDPPKNTFFLFITQNSTNVLPTIVSRAEVINLSDSVTTSQQEDHQLIALILALCQGQEVTATQLENILQKNCPDHQKSMLLVDELIQILAQNNTSQAVLAVLYNLRTTPPAPGGSKLFWRTLFMRLGLLCS